MKSNVKDDVCYAQPKTLAQRVAIANDFIKRFNYPIAFGIDDINNAANDAYSAWPERFYIIDESGHIAYRGGMGPCNYNPDEVARGSPPATAQAHDASAAPAATKPSS
jgi:hypothetical protein